MALPDAACPGLLRKPLDAAIEQLLAPYRPSGRQGNSKQNDDKKMYLKETGNFDGRGGAPVQYRVHCPIEEV
jgi:hypothetical protein